MHTTTSILNQVLMRTWFLQEGPDPFSATSQFQYSYFYGLGNIGLWIIFLLIALASVVYIIYDSQNRNIPASNWRLGVILLSLLLIPTILFRFSVSPQTVDDYFVIRGEIEYLQFHQEPADWRVLVAEKEATLSNYPFLTGYIEIIMFLGIIGGLGSLALAVAYYITYKDYSEPIVDYGPDYASTGDNVPPPPTAQEQPVNQPIETKPKAHAWLISKDGHSFQLNLGDTTLGRSSRNDIKIDDTTTSKQHAKIVEKNGHFRIYDLGAKNGTRVNDRLVREPVLLAPDDEIQMGDRTFFRFVTSRM